MFNWKLSLIDYVFSSCDCDFDRVNGREVNEAMLTLSLW